MATAERLVEEQGLLTEPSAVEYLRQLGYIVIKPCESTYAQGSKYTCELPKGHEGKHYSKGKASKVWWP